MNKAAKQLGNFLILIGLFVILTSTGHDTSLDNPIAMREQHEASTRKTIAGAIITFVGVIYKIEVN